MSRILITGGAGFIGSNLASFLLDRGHEVTVLDNRRDLKNLEGILDRVHHMDGDIRDRALLEDLFGRKRMHGVVHLAAVSRVIWGEEDPARCVDINLNGTKTLLEAMVKGTPVRPWFIYGSSREVYGECDRLPVREDAPKAPINVYGHTKLDCERFLAGITMENGLRSIALRFSNAYGNEKDIMDRVIPRFVMAGLRGERLEIHGGNQMFDFTHIDDTVEGIARSMELLESKAGTGSGPYFNEFHILCGKGVTLQQLCGIISQNLRKDLDIAVTTPRTYDVDRFFGDPSKACEVLGFRASIDIDQGVAMTIARLREHLDDGGDPGRKMRSRPMVTDQTERVKDGSLESVEERI